MLLLSLLLFLIGLFILIKGADFLVSGASAISLKFKINPMVIGLTVVAFGTSTPELVVSVTSALAGNTNIALGNVLGSNIANILLILGVCAMLVPISVNKNTVWKEIPMSFLAALVLAILGLQDVIDKGTFNTILSQPLQIIGHISFSNGLILILFFIIFIYYTFGIAKVASDSSPDIRPLPLPRSIVFIIGGLIGLILGSQLAVDNAIVLAKSFGMSDTLIGLTLVAVGTSLPELSTSIVAAKKKEVELLVGNIVGSNIFNIFLILGVTSLVKPIPLTAPILLDIIVLFLATILLFISLFVARKFRLEKIEGAAMLTTYIVYLIIIIQRG